MHRFLAVRPSGDGGRLRLFCFHHAGAGALAFAGWQPRVGRDVDVLPIRLPGREALLKEPRITDAEQLVHELQQDLGPLLDSSVPHAFYGHSLGALVAYRLTQHRLRAGLPPSRMLLVGACAAPQAPLDLLDARDPAELTDEELMVAFSDTQSLPEPLRRRPGRLTRVLATLRSDLLLARSLRSAPADALPCSLRAFAGRDDSMVSTAQVRAWRHCTSAGFRLDSVPGTHFFVRGRELPQRIGEVLRSLAPFAPPVPTG
ncbi:MULTISPECIES: thioesterase II family protein [Streptomyces]|uniref:thioesterase II family protein n=1 Tax=Streptomyces TaxID=1883 RepID=UPI001E2901BA|nr:MULTISPECIES: alpha/beta fold hydrolase [Streptomyces]UFQ18609.1 thioesterase [Streptomyces huasconensis]WCL88224.1 thioesterase domain-containing protein [Streptomyces sp. JCM 35825]